MNRIHFLAATFFSPSPLFAPRRWRGRGNWWSFAALALTASLAAFAAAPAHAAPDQTYVWHGTLQSGDEAASGNHHFQLRLFAQPSGGSTLTPTPLNFLNVPVDAQGRFALDLSWDSLPLPTAGGWLEISLRPSSGGSYSVLSPRQYIGHVPYARHAPMAGFAASVPNASIGSAKVNVDQVQLRVPTVCAASRAMYQIDVNGTAQCRGYASIGALSGGNGGTGGHGVLVTHVAENPGQWRVWLSAGSIGGQHLAANAVTTPKFKAGAVTTAKLANSAVGSAAINSTQVQRRISGFCTNAGRQGAMAVASEDGSVTCAVDHLNGINGNQVATDTSTGESGFVGSGGHNNNTHEQGVIGGGRENVSRSASFVGGGYRNISAGLLMGGRENENLMGTSLAPGGMYNCPGAASAFTAGFRAKVRNGASNTWLSTNCQGIPSDYINGDQQVFIWSDSQNADLISTAPRQFIVRAAGGIHFGTNNTVSLSSGRFISTSTGAYLSTGGTWTNASSRAWKTPFQAIDTGAILDAVRALPMTTWQYIASPGEGRHLGPMAEDFHAAFNVGDATSISTTDASGVALAAIQGLAARSAEGFEALQARLAAENAALAGEIAELEAMLDGLEGVAVSLLPSGEGARRADEGATGAQ